MHKYKIYKIGFSEKEKRLRLQNKLVFYVKTLKVIRKKEIIPLITITYPKIQILKINVMNDIKRRMKKIIITYKKGFVIPWVKD